MIFLVAAPFILLIAAVFLSMAWHFGKELAESLATPCKYFLLKRLVVHSATVECKKAYKEKMNARRH